jgi:uncharacterized membrane protein
MARPNKSNREIRRLAEQLQVVQEISALQVTQTVHAGPLPDPDTLARYEQAMPGLAAHIVQSQKEESEHRRGLEKRFLDAQIDDAKAYRAIESRGQLFALIVSVVTISAGVAIVISGHPIAGTGLSGGTIVALTGLFIYGRTREEKSPSVKRSDGSHASDNSPTSKVPQLSDTNP